MLGRKRHQDRGSLAPLATLFALLLGACSGDAGLFASSDANHAKRDWGLIRDWNLLAKDDGAIRPIEQTDLVGSDGHCNGTLAASPALNFQAGPEAPRPANSPPGPTPPGSPAGGRGIALGMTECEVAGAAGHPDQVEISTNERGRRSVVLTYWQGAHPGVYRFEAGRLKSIERGPTAAAPPKPTKPSRKAASKPAAPN